MSTDNETTTNPNNSQSQQPAAEKIGETAKNMAQKTYGDFLGAYKSFSETSSKVVQQAASILESEMAAGIRIASQTENKIPQIEKFRSEKPDEVMQRFRRDAHEVVDIFIDVVGATLKSVPNLADSTVARVENITVKPVKTEKQKPTLTAEAVKAGQSAIIEMSFENSKDTETDEFKLFSTDLISSAGERLPSGLVTFAPLTIKIPPNQTLQATVTVMIPEETSAGTYTGLVLASNMPELKTEIVIKVE
ncbi:MAG: hypothetical protein NWE92_12505 [Candidatus Bathyarchaeota archaeon]|nr:hypothetical protein [Candidatus Bathyarchaeota archaeon]